MLPGGVGLSRILKDKRVSHIMGREGKSRQRMPHVHEYYMNYIYFGGTKQLCDFGQFLHPLPHL